MTIVLYRRIVSINGRDYLIDEQDFSRSIEEQIKAEVLEDDSQSILESLSDHIAGL